MDLKEQIAQMTDQTVAYCLNAMIETEAERNSKFQERIASEQLNPIVQAASAGVDLPPDWESRRVARAVLFAMADDPDLSPRLVKIAADQRETRFDPITLTLVAAGVVLVLSTKFKIEVEVENGKTKVKFSAEKNATPPAIIKKVLGFLH